MKDKMKLLTNKKNINYTLIIAVFALVWILDLAGLLKGGDEKLLITIGINIVLAVSLNLLVGYLGELTLGHAGFMCVGAFLGKYVSMQLASLPVIVSFPIAVLVGGLVAAVFGLLIGLPAMRLRGDYLAIVTLAFGEIIRNVILNMETFGGAIGLVGNTKVTSYPIVFLFILITLVVIQNLVYSRHGRAIRAIRNNDIAARSVGINITYYKLLAFVVAAFFAGVAGVLYSHNLRTVNSSSFSYNKSIEILVFVVLGGMGNITGSIIAATVITLIPEWFRPLEDYRMLLYSIVLIAIMLSNASPAFKNKKDMMMAKVKAWFANMVKKNENKTAKGDK